METMTAVAAGVRGALGRGPISWTGGESRDDVPDDLRAAGPVLLVGGFATPAVMLEPMARWLTRCGHDVLPLALGAGMDCGGRTSDLLAGRVEDLAERTGCRVGVVAHSRGGQFARSACSQVPERVASLVTLGTPFDLYGLSWPLLSTAVTLSALGSLGVPRLARLACLTGSCCARFRSDLRGPWPETVPFTSIYSHADRSVPAVASHDPHATNVEVTASHFGLLTGRSPRRAVAQALAAALADAGSAATGSQGRQPQRTVRARWPEARAAGPGPLPAGASPA